MTRTLSLIALLAAVACSQPAPAPEAAAPPAALAPVATEAPAGRYTLDKLHASLLFSVNHIGFSNYTARFPKFDATLDFDPADPSKMVLNATVDARSLALENPPPGFTQEILGPDWLDARTHPTMTFKSTAVELTAPNAAKVTGDFTMHGVTKPVTLEVTFNGGYAGHPYDPNARIGFSAKGTLKRSEFGVSNGLPPPGSTMGVGDEVRIVIETEFNGPPLPGAQKK